MLNFTVRKMRFSKLKECNTFFNSDLEGLYSADGVSICTVCNAGTCTGF